MADELDWHAAIDELQEAWENTPPAPYGPIDLDRNAIAYRIDTELLDHLRLAREINERMTAAFLDAHRQVADELVGDIEHWQPVGILNVVPPFDFDHEARNARAASWWRSQRHR